jgi:hypothetical protein
MTKAAFGRWSCFSQRWVQGALSCSVLAALLSCAPTPSSAAKPSILTVEAWKHHRADNFAEAEQPYIQALEQWEAELGPDAAAVALSRSSLARTHDDMENLSRAEILHREALALLLGFHTLSLYWETQYDTR